MDWPSGWPKQAMKKWISYVLIAVLVSAAAFYGTADKETRGLIANLPTNKSVLFWSSDTRSAAFRAMDRLGFLAKSREVAASDKPLLLTQGEPFTAGAIDFTAYMTDQGTAGMVIVQDGRIREERYGLDFDAKGRWTSFSVAKSFTSTLVGAAIKDGFIKSLDDKVSDYIPDLKGSVYEQVSVQQLLTMTSGVQWDENYFSPTSDVARFNDHKAPPGKDVTVSYMRTLKRAAPPGSRWLYSTGETNLIGVLVSSATGKSVSQYLSEKVWAPFGMEQKASWILGSSGHEISGCCVSAATRDYARFGLFMLAGGVVNGKAVLPDDWVAKATTKQADINAPGRGYGFQWWTYDDGSYAAQGIFGQGIFIDPKRKLVIATNGNWHKATEPGGLNARRDQFYKQVQAVVDGQADKFR